MDQKDTSLPSSIGPYRVDNKIATGGMGEIYLVQDPYCDRKIALKKIRSDRLQYPTLKERFVREAKIAAQMTHPSIIPIYSIHSEKDDIYYTMPFVEGRTLKQVLISALEEERTTPARLNQATSIHSLLRIFLSICQGIAYCHNRGVLHRDIKPENIIVGKYGETLILDWGLADFIDAPLMDLEKHIPSIELIDLTRPGKIPGTLSYIAPERILGHSSSYSSDVYALGVILYQVLTLRMPFSRTKGKGLKKQIEKEELIDPLERAPYRDIPLELSSIAKRCLQPSPLQRYQRVEEIIKEIESFLEGQGRWYLLPTVDIQNKHDWEFQENILLAHHVALTRSSDLMQWVTLMISKKGLAETFKMQTTVEIGADSQGIGILLNIPEPQQRKGPLGESLCLWIGSFLQPGCMLQRSHAQILFNPQVCLSPGKTYQIRIEKEEGHLRLFINDEEVFDYLCILPFDGPHFGVMLKDGDTRVDPIEIYVRSPSIKINCLKVPDSFLLAKQYTKALVEYKKIAASFPGRIESRQAIFRSGITLIEKSLHSSTKNEKEHLLQNALDEFSSLRTTPSAPLEFIGKSLVYKASADTEEETKCLDIALRKYPKHPLVYLIEEEVMFRLHEAAYQNKQAAYHFFLLALHHMPALFMQPYHSALLTSLQKSWHPLPLLEKIVAPTHEEKCLSLCIHLAFWLVKPYALIEIVEKQLHPILTANAIFCLLVLGFNALAEESLHTLKDDEERLLPLYTLLQVKEKKIRPLDAFYQLENKENISAKRALFILIEENKELQSTNLLKPLSQKEPLFYPTLLFSIIENDTTCLQQDLQNALPYLSQKWAHFFKGCVKAIEQGKQQALYYLADNPTFFAFDTLFVQKEGVLSKDSLSSLFFWERVELLRQAHLFSLCANEKEEAIRYSKLLLKEKNRIKKLFFST